MKPGDLERVRIERETRQSIRNEREKAGGAPFNRLRLRLRIRWLSHPAWQVLGQNRKRAEPEADMGVQTIGTIGGVYTTHLCGGREAHLA